MRGSSQAGDGDSVAVLFARDGTAVTISQGETLVESLGSRALARIVGHVTRTVRVTAATGEEEIGRASIVVDFNDSEPKYTIVIVRLTCIGHSWCSNGDGSLPVQNISVR